MLEPAKLFFTVNIHLEIGQIVPYLLQNFQIEQKTLARKMVA
jgi:hypothetical protein